MDGLLGIANRLIESNKHELNYEDEILLNDDLSESSLAYAVPHDSYSSREVQGAESPAKSSEIQCNICILRFTLFCYLGSHCFDPSAHSDYTKEV